MTEASPEEVMQEVKRSEKELIRAWFEEKITDEEKFTDKLDYQYYARTLGLDKDYFLDIDNWEVFYNDHININRDIDGVSIYLIRLDPYKLLEIYAQNNNTGVEQICDYLGASPEKLYYNWGYTMTSYEYTLQHNENNCTYSQGEANVFGADNGEHRSVVMSTHLLMIEDDKVNYTSSSDKLRIRQRDLLRSSGTKSYDFIDYTEEERTPSLYVNNVGISKVIKLDLFNGYKDTEDITSVVMVNMSPFSYGCTDEDKIDMSVDEGKTEETETTTASEEETTIYEDGSTVSDETYNETTMTETSMATTAGETDDMSDTEVGADNE